VPLANGELHAVAGPRRRRVEKRGRGGDRHELHGAHAEWHDGLVAHQDQVRRWAGDDRPSNLVGRGTEDGAPDARREGREKRGEQQDGDRARNEGSSTWWRPSPNRTL